MKRSPHLLRGAHLRFGVLCVLGYVTLAWVVRFDMRRGEQIASVLYPLDTFSMYAGAPGQQMSHLLVRDGQGGVHSVKDFRSFACDQPIAGTGARCANGHGIAYHFDDLVHYIESHGGSGSLDVELISRTWEVRSGKPPDQLADCLIARCRVSR